MPPEEPQADHDEQELPARAQEIDSMWPVWVWRILGSLIVVISLALGIKVAIDADIYSFWRLLATIVTPMGIGFLILVISEVLNRLRRTSQ